VDLSAATSIDKNGSKFYILKVQES
jgi:hypothetical protein